MFKVLFLFVLMNSFLEIKVVKGVDIPRKLCVYTTSCFYLGSIDACEDGTFCSTSNLPQGQCIEKVSNGPLSPPSNCITTNNWGCGAPGMAACCNPAVKCIDRMCRLSSNGCSYDGYYSNTGSQQPVLKPTTLVLRSPTMIPSATSKQFQSTFPTFSPSQKRSDALSSMPTIEFTTITLLTTSLPTASRINSSPLPTPQTTTSTLPSASPTSTNSPTTIVQRSSVPSGSFPRKLCVYTTSCFYLGTVDACEDGTFCSTSNLPQGQCIEKVSAPPPSNCITTNNWGCGAPGTAACCNPAVKCIDRMCRLSSNGCSYEGYYYYDASNPGSQQPVLKPTTLVLTTPTVVPVAIISSGFLQSRNPTVSTASLSPTHLPTMVSSESSSTPTSTRTSVQSLIPTTTSTPASVPSASPSIHPTTEPPSISPTTTVLPPSSTPAPTGPSTGATTSIPTCLCPSIQPSLLPAMISTTIGPVSSNYTFPPTSTQRPTDAPMNRPSRKPFKSVEPPLQVRTLFPTRTPTQTWGPTISIAPSTVEPTEEPSYSPTDEPSFTRRPSRHPAAPTEEPSIPPTEEPTAPSTIKPTTRPPTCRPTKAAPSARPTARPSKSASPTEEPSDAPTGEPTARSTARPSRRPTRNPTTGTPHY